MTRFAAVALLCVFASPADAMTCRDVRKAVAAYGQSAVVSWAKWQGYSEKQIKEIARKCLARQS